MSFFGSDSRRELRPDLAIEIYCDESSQNGHRFLVIGMLEMRKSLSSTVFARLAEERGEYKGEIKWKKLSDKKLPHYRRWVDATFDLIKRRYLRFYALVADSTEFDHKKYNEGDGEIGFSKLLYQLLLHNAGTPHLGIRPVYGYLDDRTTKHDPENLRQMLNAGLAKHRYKIVTKPFRRLTFTKSTECDAIQALDLLIGALAWHYNGRGLRADARQCKDELCQYILGRSKERGVNWRFKIWEFHFNQE